MVEYLACFSGRGLALPAVLLPDILGMRLIKYKHSWVFTLLLGRLNITKHRRLPLQLPQRLCHILYCFAGGVQAAGLGNVSVEHDTQWAAGAIVLRDHKCTAYVISEVARAGQRIATEAQSMATEPPAALRLVH